MKSAEWAVKFAGASDVTQVAGLLAEYGLETRELVDNRTKNSKPETKASAADGALREQRQKFVAVCGKVKSLIPEMFDGVVAKDLADVKGEIDKWKAQPKAEKKEKATTDGRKLVN